MFMILISFFIDLGLYKKEERYWEQPSVLFRNVLYLQVLDDDGVSWTYSTVKWIENINPNPLSMPTIKVSQLDHNSDGKID